MFFIYMTYTLLALHVEECTVSGLLLGFTQVTSRRTVPKAFLLSKSGKYCKS